MAKYVGPRWPLSEILTEALYPELYRGYQQLQDDLRAEHARKAKAIDQDADLSAQGRQRKQRELTETFRADPRVKAFADTLAKARAREAEIRNTLTKRTPPKPKGSDAAEIAAALIERSFQRHRTLERYERLSPEAQREACRRAVDAMGTGDAAAAEFLSDLRGEAGVLDPKMAARVDAALMKNANADLFRELEQLAGRLQVDGRHDLITSISRCAETTWQCFMEFLDEAAGIPAGARDAQAAVDAATTADAITLNVEQGHDVQTFRLAHDRAQAEGKELRIVGPEGEGTIDPGELAPITANGSGASE